MTESFFDSKEVITREWLEEMLKPQEEDDDEIQLRPIDELCAEWVGRTVGEFAKFGLRRAANEVLNEGMLPYVQPIEMETKERFIAWKFFKAEVIQIAGEHEGQRKQAALDAVLERYHVSEVRKQEVGYYTARALEIRHNAIQGVPFVDPLPPMGTLVLGD